METAFQKRTAKGSHEIYKINFRLISVISQSQELTVPVNMWYNDHTICQNQKRGGT